MKLFAFFISLLGLALAGCDSISDATSNVRAKLAARDQPRTRVFSADQRATYEAARAALEPMGFRFVRGGPAQGELEAVSGLLTGDSRQTRQITLKARFGLAAASGTEVQLWLKEIVEPAASRATGRASERPLRDTPLYEVFFREVQTALGANSNSLSR